PSGESEDARLARAAGRYAGVGLQFAVSIVVFLYAGQWVDRRFGTAPWGVLAGVFVGASAAFYSIYRRLMADLRREEERKRP
ncbi:MAG: AtpZ/AtpI family protein, partial [Gemmatimonadota bacterium]